MKEDDAVIFVRSTIQGHSGADGIQSQGSLIPDWVRCCPPEISKSGWSEVAKFPIHAVDAFMYGILVFEAFNGTFGGPDQLTMPKNIPVGMQQGYKRLISANPKVRISVAQFLELGMKDGGFFNTPLILLTDGIENLGVKDEPEREQILSWVASNVK
jgi:SCY1-like protein 1